MATVYLAQDLKHDRQVAVKVLKEDLAAALGADRFLREIKITARLNHPHILPLLDSGQANGFLYYVMPHAAGGSLRACLGGGRPLDLGEAVRITQQVAAALDHAHRHDVVHRDIKPENILFSEGLAIVADFGIAKALSTVSRDALTRSGYPLGTPGYMSPEQAAGITQLDQRTDVFGLACVVHEMLIGETPGMWPSDEALRLGRFLDATSAHRDRLDRLPGRLEQILVKALAIRPDDRFATPGAFASALAAGAERRDKLPEPEVQEIIERASHLDAEHPTEEPVLSIGGVEQVAAQVGIPPARVREAVQELREPPAGAVGTAIGTPAAYDWIKDRLSLDREVEAEIPESMHPALVQEIQETLGIVGHASVLGGTLTWSPAAPGTESRKLVITITPTITSHGGRTLIHIEERFEIAGWRLMVPAWGAAAGGLLSLPLIYLLGGDSAPFVALPFAGAGGILAATGLLRGSAMRRRPQLERLADRLATFAAQATLPPAR
jgi:hypothetical protein